MQRTHKSRPARAFGFGVVPNTELAANAGLQVDNGIVINEFAQTSNPDIVAAWYLKEDKVIAADCINRPVEFMLAKQLIQNNKCIAVSELEDDSIDAKALLAQLKS